jgi:cyclopropane fatty-acyl-phospholipid synthase-like methyltransferase
MSFLSGLIFSPICVFILYIFNWFIGHFGLSIVNYKNLVRNCYDTADIFIGQEHTSTGLDYGYNFYNGNKSLSPKEAQLNKYKYMWDKLKLREGSHLLDIGCGYGDWMVYCKSKGVKCIGINISKSQCVSAKKRNLNIINKDWEQVTDDDLPTKFDAITCMDTIEHYVNPFDKFKLNKSDAKYEKLMNFIANNLKDKGIFLTSCLFLQTPCKNWTPYLWLSAFCIDYSMSGYYPQLNASTGSDMGYDQLTCAAKKHDLKLISSMDTTENYRISQVWNTECWQNAKNLNSKSIYWLIKNIIQTYYSSPSFGMSFLGYFNIGWTSFWGKEPLNDKYDSELRKKITHVRSFVAVYSKKY